MQYLVQEEVKTYRNLEVAQRTYEALVNKDKENKEVTDDTSRVPAERITR